MSSSTTVTNLTFIGQQITIYAGLTILVLGIIGGLFNIVVFLSLETFRQSSCAFYLLILSIVNVGQLALGFLSRIMIYGFGIDWTTTSLFYCKFRTPFAQLCSLVSYTCLCLATIDQYFATCSRPRWQQWSNIQLASRLIIIFLIVWIIFLIPYPIYLDQITSTSGKVTCTLTTNIMLQYRNYFIILFLSGYIPVSITVLFGILAYRNVQQIAYRTVPLVRRELDKQLTIMVFVQIIINFFTSVPCVTLAAIMYATASITDANFNNIIQFIYSMLLMIFYSYFASSFYIYICVSQRFRRQFKYVLFDLYINRWRQHRVPNNQIAPT